MIAALLLAAKELGPPILHNLRKYWKPVAFLIAFAGLALWGAIGWSGKRHAEMVAKNEAMGRKLDQQTYRAEQAAFAVHALDMARRKDAENLKIKDNADARYTVLAADYQRQLAAFVRGHSPASGANSGADLSRASADAQGPDRPGEAAELRAPVCLTDEDANTLMIGLARLQAAHEWALALQTGK
jgi:hypothetical protein